MTTARLVVDLRDSPWSDATRGRSDRVVRIRSAVPCDGAGVELVEVSCSDVDECVSRVENHPSVEYLTIVERTADEVTMQLETVTPRFLLAVRESRMAVEFPIEIRHGTATIDVVGPHEHLSTLDEQLRQLDVAFDLVSVGTGREATKLLTEAQRDLLLAAVEEGYYETPRQCTLTELADSVGLAKSTCSESLHRIEQIVVEYFVDELPAAPRSEKRLATA